MAGSFDPQDRDSCDDYTNTTGTIFKYSLNGVVRVKTSWYFGPLNREDANRALNKVRENGVFLVRDSNTIRGDFVLCVKEENKNSHYIINKILVNSVAKFRIGDQEFNDLPSLLAFYKTHYLDTTPLIMPVSMDVREKRIAIYDFPGRDPEDLPFKKGEILSILRKDEDQWWTARNTAGMSGQVPVPYIEQYEEPSTATVISPANEVTQRQVPSAYQQELVVPKTSRPLPAKAEVIRARTPSAFDQTALRLKVGDIVTVTAMHINGQWEGECNNVTGLFPFTHVKFLDDIEEENQ